jgi:hypothetical protein
MTTFREAWRDLIDRDVKEAAEAARESRRHIIGRKPAGYDDPAPGPSILKSKFSELVKGDQTTKAWNNRDYTQ